MTADNAVARVATFTDAYDGVSFDNLHSVAPLHGPPLTLTLTDLREVVRAARLVDEQHRLMAEFEKAGLLEDEYPEDMARRACTCEPDAICAAHRLLGRYSKLFDALQQANREKREAKAAARLVDDMAAVVNRLNNGWHVVHGPGDYEGWIRADGPYKDREEPMSPGEVAALDHARQQEET